MVSSYHVNLGNGGAAGQAVGVVLYVWEWRAVREGASVKGSVIPTRSPSAFLLRYEMEGIRPWNLGLSAGLPASWRRTQHWRRPSGLVPGGVGTRLQVGRLLCGCDVLCCAGTRGDSLLAWSAREFLQEAVW